MTKEARVPLGNVYYYFKTKDDIGRAIVELRVSRFGKLLEELDQAKSPKERLCGFVDIKIKNREALARSGCPVGTWCSELHKDAGAVAKKSTLLFAQGLAWMETQFKALGKGPESRGLAVHLMSETQGVSVLAHTFHDPDMISMEAARLKKWIRAFDRPRGLPKIRRTAKLLKTETHYVRESTLSRTLLGLLSKASIN